MSKTELLNQILNGSMQYQVKDGILELTGYYTGKRIYINLREIDEEALMTEEEYEEQMEEE